MTRRPTLAAEIRALRRRLRAAEAYCDMLELESTGAIVRKNEPGWKEEAEAWKAWKKLHDASKKHGRK